MLHELTSSGRLVVNDFSDDVECRDLHFLLELRVVDKALRRLHRLIDELPRRVPRCVCRMHDTGFVGLVVLSCTYCSSMMSSTS